MIRVLVAEDSSTARALLVSILSADPAIDVVGQAKDGLEAVEMVVRLRPDIVTMDIDMPMLNGFEATKRIMIEAPTPIVIVTGISDARQVAASMQALTCGALSLLPKPSGPMQPGFDEVCRHTVETVKSLSQVKVVGHRLEVRRRPSDSPQLAKPGGGGIVAIAASTGGPSAIQRILSELPGDFGLPILVVQHLARGFVEGFALWMSGACSLPVQVAVHGMALRPGTVYVAPDDRHLGVRSGMALLDHEPPIGGFQPSGTYLFASVAKVYGSSVIAVILTGMGADGTAGLRAVKQAGGRVIAQDEDTSVVFGMPASAIAEGMADEIVPLRNIAGRLVSAAARFDKVAQRGGSR
jgi:two-component system chemotaxis response regulator CheB